MIKWNLKSQLAKEHQIYTVTELQKLVVKKTGVLISVANLCNYVNNKPKMVKLETIQIICSALGCELKSFLSVTPESPKVGRTRKLSFKNTPKSKIGQTSFPEPSDYESR